MTRKRVRWYMISVLAYYRSEWTDVADDDDKFRLLVTEDLEDLLLGCLKRKTSIPNAAKEVEIFLALKPKTCQACDSPISVEERKIKSIKKKNIKDEKPESGGSPGEKPIGP